MPRAVPARLIQLGSERQCPLSHYKIEATAATSPFDGGWVIQINCSTAHQGERDRDSRDQDDRIDQRELPCEREAHECFAG
jgi:hypothetical protein